MAGGGSNRTVVYRTRLPENIVARIRGEAAFLNSPQQDVVAAGMEAYFSRDRVDPDHAYQTLLREVRQIRSAHQVFLNLFLHFSLVMFFLLERLFQNDTTQAAEKAAYDWYTRLYLALNKPPPPPRRGAESNGEQTDGSIWNPARGSFVDED